MGCCKVRDIFGGLKMEQIILNSLERAEDQLENFSTKEDLARYIADELKRAIAEQLMEQLNHL